MMPKGAVRSRLETFKPPRVANAPRGSVKPTKFGGKIDSVGRFSPWRAMAMARMLLNQRNMQARAMLSGRLGVMERQAGMDTGGKIMMGLRQQLQNIDQLLEQVAEQEGGLEP